MNNRTALTFLTLALLLTAILGFTSCASKPPPTGPTTLVNPGAGAAKVAEFGGEVVMDTASITSTIVSVDHVKRLVVVKRPDGSTNTWFATRDAVAFDQLKAGDRIRLSVAEQLAVFIGTNSVPATKGTNAPSTDPALAAKLRARLPASTLAVATEIVTLSFSGKIVALDDWNDTVTLLLSDGLARKIHVSEYVNLADMNVGDSVSVRCTQAAAIELDKP